MGRPAGGASGRGQVRRRVRGVVRQGPGPRPHRRCLPPCQPCRHVQARRRARADGRRPHLRKLDIRAPVRVRLRRLHDPGAEPGRRAGDPGLRDSRVRPVALRRRVGRHQVREGQHRGHRHRRWPHRSRPDQDPRRLRHAAQGPQHPARRPGARQGSAPARLQARGHPGLRPRQQARPHRHERRAEPQARHHHLRQELSRRAPGAGRARHRRGQGQPARHPPLQGRHDLAARAAGRAQIRARASTPSW